MTNTAFDVWCASATYRAVNTVSRLFAQATAWNEARRTRAILSRLSLQELDDIGLSRGDIDAIR